jgi:hypothetical protein
MYVRELVDFFLTHIISQEFAVGRRLRIDDVPESLATEITQGLHEAQMRGGCPADVEIFVLRTGQKSAGIYLNRDDMVNKRNRVEKLVMFVPEAEGVTEGSLDNSFQRTSFQDILSSAISSSIESAKSHYPQLQFSELIRISKKPFLSQIDVWEFWSGLNSKEIAQFGLELWRLNLIPDSGPDYLDRILDNESCSDAILSRTKPLRPLHDRLTNASLGSGTFRTFLESELDPLPANFKDWFRSIAESKLAEASFHLWPIVQNYKSLLRQISLVPFRGKDGEPNRACKLVKDEQGRLVATDSVVVSWTADPDNVDRLAYFEVQVLPVEELRDEETSPLYLKLLGPSARTHKITFNLDDETELVAAYVIRISAITTDGGILQCQDGSVASVESEDFSIHGAAEDSEFARKSNASSIYEGVLDALINRDVKVASLDAPSSHSGYFTIRLNNKRIIRIPTNPNLDSLMAKQIRDAEFPGRFVARGLRSSSFSSSQFHKIDIPLSRELMRRRVKFFKLLSAQGSARMLPQFAEWNAELVRSCEEYVDAYFSALKRSQEQGDLSILWLDCLHLSLDENSETEEYAISTPLHPLRLAWFIEFNQAAESWASALSGLMPKVRRRSFDLGLFAEIAPRNLPWLAPGSSAESPLVYQNEFSNNYGFYAHPSNSHASRDLASLREFFQIEGGSQYEARDLPRALARRFNDFIQAQPSQAPFSVFLVNPGDGRAYADAFKLLGSKTYPAEMPRTRILASGEMGVSARPIAALQDFSDEVEEKLGSSDGPFYSHPLELRVLGRNVIPDDESINLSVIRNFSMMDFVQVPESRQAPHLRGLVNPLISEFLPSTGETLVSAPLGRSKSRTDANSVIPGAHQAFIEALARANGFEGGSLGLKVLISAPVGEDVTDIQAQSDWMMTVDDFMPIQSMEALLKNRNSDTVILDYSPDFIDGFGPRISVSTSHVGQLESVVQSALERLQVSGDPFAAKRIVRDLGLLSGRLPLVIMKDNSEAVGAIGLAAAVRHMKVTGTLSKTVIIPLDSHLELFREEPTRNQRCDLLLVKFASTSYSLEFVEVKNYSKVNPGLLEHMKSQIDNSVTRLDYLTNSGTNAVDRDLQWARWSGLLRFYTSRAFAHGLLTPEEFEKLNSGISRIELNHEAPANLHKTGIVVNIPGDTTLANKYLDMRVIQLSAVQFEQTILKDNFSELM